MLNEPTRDRLKALKLDAMAQAWDDQQRNPEMQQLGFDERLGMLVDSEWISRENKRVDRLLKEAKLKLSQACVEDIDYPAKRGLDKAVIRQLATCRWLHEHQNIAITGLTGTGKTFVACALAQLACRKGCRALYRRASRLSDELTLARADGTYSLVLKKIARAEVLVIDDWALTPIREQDRRDLYELMEDRHGLHSTIIASQLPIAKWHDYFGEPTVADAILDRVLSNAHRLVLKGPSRRPTENKEEITEN